uniref:Uncharacterized protein n=1 Tax=Daphnia galeata TaxID=27404 RepID=A0A8J2RXG2_9CRUS|nr:unnamed protein product [Daphnia galeata]
MSQAWRDVHQQSASAEIQEAGPSHHQQHSAAGVLQHYPPKIESQKKQMSIPMQCNYIVIEQLLFVRLQHLLRLRRLLMATQVDIKNALAVRMHNTIPVEPELGRIKEELCLPVK